jgi:Uma2 family endonuclease
VKAARSYRPPGRGPFRADQLRPGDPYELSDGHAIVREPSGRRHGSRSLAAGAVIETDPAVDVAGVEIGHVLDEATLRCPDVSVGGFAEEPGFSRRAPRLAVEYVEVGRDETDLERKVEELLAAGTGLVWVVRLGRNPRVEAHRRGAAPEVVRPGGMLAAPGILRNPVPVDALYDREVAHERMLHNLLQRRGYEDLDALRAESEAVGEARAHDTALARARSRLRCVLEARGFPIEADTERAIAGGNDLRDLDRWLLRAVTARSVGDVFDPA